VPSPTFPASELVAPRDLQPALEQSLRGRLPWARIGEFVGQRSLSVTADVYSHVLLDETEVGYARLLAGA
jgi:hypothetical protein